MADGTTLGKAYVQIVPSAQGISSKIKGILGGPMSAEGESAGKMFAGKLISAASGLIAAAGIGKMFADSINQGAALQQSLGGVDTIFGNAADIVKKNAKEAYMYAGVSANEYMENVTSFSASLISSMGGNTKKAAAVADIAMRDMSDNANKMGTNIADIQNAYQGFAKQNYTINQCPLCW